MTKLTIGQFSNRPLCQTRLGHTGFEGDLGSASALVYRDVHEDSSTGSTYKSPAEVEFRKRSNYWLNFYKPKGISSAKLVAIVKKNLLGAKVGHCGTLDVEAEGVLPLAIGEATKLVRMLFDAKKTYIFTIQFGSQTDTADAAGKVMAITNNIPTKEQCYAICNSFVGIIQQRPPAFSAIKINGVRSYKLARENSAIELATRNIEIYNLECLDYIKENNSATYKVECSKGTYVRTLAEDIALSLQSLAFVLELARTKVGLFIAENAIRLTELELVKQEMVKDFLVKKSIKIEAVLDDILVLDATNDQAKKIIYGQKCFFESPKNIELIWIRYQGALLAIGSLSENCFNSFRVFNL